MTKTYSEYRNSEVEWLGIIPSHWSIEKGKHVLSVLSKPVQANDQVITCFRDGEVVLRSERRTIGFTMSDKEIGYQHIDKGDLVIHGMDGFAGAMGISKSTGKGSPVLIVCNPKKDNPNYLMYYLRILASTNVFQALSTGIRERSCDLKWNKISVLPFSIPPIDEQNLIASYLDEKCIQIDSLIELLENMICELKEYKKSLITEIATKGIHNPTKMKDSNIEILGDIPYDWDIMRLKNIGSLYGGLSGKSGDDFNVDPEQDNYMKFIPFTNIFNNFVIDTNLLYNVKVKDNELQNTVKSGDILFLMSSEDFDGIGKPAILEENVDNLGLNSFCKGFRNTNSKVYSKYLLYLLLSEPLRELVRIEAKGFIRINLRQDKLLSIPIIIPPIGQQYEIVQYLDDKTEQIDSLIKIKEEKIRELKESKKSLIYEYVTGKKRV